MDAAEGSPESNPFATEGLAEGGSQNKKQGKKKLQDGPEEAHPRVLEEGGRGPEASTTQPFESTIDEPVSYTLLRDLRRVGRNVLAVLLPFARNDPKRMLREWDLWGPLFGTLALGLVLTIGGNDDDAFPVAFVLIAAGTLALSINVVLLGGHIILLQSLSLLGYCLFPLLLSAIVSASLSTAHSNGSSAITTTIVNAVVLILSASSVAWACAASVPFISAAVPEEKRVLAAYPVVLVYGLIAWLNIATLST